MLPLPSRTHPKNQNPLVYTEELTHLGKRRPSEANQSTFCRPSEDRGRRQRAQTRHHTYPDC